MKVLSIGHSYVLSVNRVVMRELARLSSIEVTVAAPDRYPGDFGPLEFESEPENSGIEVVPLPVRWTHRVHIFHYKERPLRQLLQEKQFDIVHLWEEPYTLSGWGVRRAVAGLQARLCFLTCQNLPKKYPPPFNLMEKSVVRGSQRWLGIGQTVVDNMVARGYPAKTGSVMPLTVDTRMFAPMDQAGREAGARELGLQSPLIGFMGRLVPEKGLSVLMKALDRLSPDLPWNLLVLGAGPMEAELKNWMRTRNYENRVRILLARHQDVPRYLALMDLLVAPSQTRPNWKEQFGRMLVEAFASGVPVIGSDSGEIPHVVGDAGMIVGESDVEGWARAIDELLRKPELREKRRRQGCERAQEFSAMRIAQRYGELFESMMASSVIVK